MDPGQAIEAFALARALREDAGLYAAVRIAHLVAMAVLVGGAVLFDLRLLGLSRALPVRQLARHVLPWSAAALLVLLPTGLAMFAAHAGELLSDRAFQAKMALLLAAGVNAAVFHTGVYTRVAEWDAGAPAPVAARLAAAVSLVVWVSVVACGALLRPG